MAELPTSVNDKILKILESLQEEQKRIEKRLDALEEHLENLLLPSKRGISPAIQDTLKALQKLAGPAGWVSTQQVSGETRRSIQTEENYVRKLHQLGIVRRQTFASSRGERKRREYRYRPKK